MVEFLVENASANVSFTNKAGETPLFGAVYEGHFDTVKYLLERGADANKVAKHQETPIFEAIRGCHIKWTRRDTCQKYVDIAEKLKKHNADFDVQNNRSYSPLALASHFGQVKIVRYEINYYFNILRIEMSTF